MSFHTGMHRMMNATDEKPKLSRPLLKRVLAYALPYRWSLVAMLLLILATTGLSLLNPLIVRNLIDQTIPQKNLTRLVWLALALLMIPALSGAMNVLQRRLSSNVGEGVIYDLRVALYSGLQRMSLRFFTNTKIGELMSRLNNDVVGAQTAISSTIISIVTEVVQAAAVLVVMFTLEWRLTLIALVIMPLFIVASRKLMDRLRDISRHQLEANAQMNAMMNETLNIGGALLVKLFGQRETEVNRFSDRAHEVRSLGVDRAFTGSLFFAIVGLISAVGTALVYGLGGYFVISGKFTVGTIVAFGSPMLRWISRLPWSVSSACSRYSICRRTSLKCQKRWFWNGYAVRSLSMPFLFNMRKEMNIFSAMCIVTAASRTSQRPSPAKKNRPIMKRKSPFIRRRVAMLCKT